MISWSASPRKGSSPRSSSRDAASIASRRRPTCRSSSPRRRTGFGHSMVREVYSHNRIFTPGQPRSGYARPAVQIHRPVRRNHRRSRAQSGTAAAAASGAFQQLDHRLAPLSSSASRPIPPMCRSIASRKLDPFLIPQLHDLPGGGGSLPFRNLKRGVLLGLPSGQDVAKAMKIKNPLTPGRDREGNGWRGRKEARPA